MHIKHVWSKHDGFGLAAVFLFFLGGAALGDGVLEGPLVRHLLQPLQGVPARLPLALVLIQAIFFSEEKLQVLRLFHRLVENGRLSVCIIVTIEIITVTPLTPAVLASVLSSRLMVSLLARSSWIAIWIGRVVAHHGVSSTSWICHLLLGIIACVWSHRGIWVMISCGSMVVMVFVSVTVVWCLQQIAILVLETDLFLTTSSLLFTLRLLLLWRLLLLIAPTCIIQIGFGLLRGTIIHRLCCVIITIRVDIVVLVWSRGSAIFHWACRLEWSRHLLLSWGGHSG